MTLQEYTYITQHDTHDSDYCECVKILQRFKNTLDVEGINVEHEMHGGLTEPSY